MSKKVQDYAMRFLKLNKPRETSSLAEAPTTPDRISDSGTLGMPWEEHLTEVWTKFPYIYLVCLSMLTLVIHLSLSRVLYFLR